MRPFYRLLAFAFLIVAGSAYLVGAAARADDIALLNQNNGEVASARINISELEANYATNSIYTPANPISYRTVPTYVAPPAPPPTYIDAAAMTYCRPYSQHVHVDGHMHETYGRACLQPNGDWRIVH